jgi:hypothetical protein
MSGSVSVFIYALCDPRDGAIRYVGKTNNLARRLKNHRNEKKEFHKSHWLKLLTSLQLNPIIRILEETCESCWRDRERWWIKHCREIGCDLTNHTDGGDGVSGLDAEARKKVSKATTIRMNDPEFRRKIFTPIRAAKISQALSGKPKSPEHVAKLIQNHRGWKHREDSKAKISNALLGNQYRTGIPHTEATIAILRDKNLGNKSRTGMNNSPEMNAKISAFQKGRPKTALQRKRMSEARRLWWERKRNVA